MNGNSKPLEGRVFLYIGGFELPDKNAAAQRVISNGKVLRSLGAEVIFLGVAKNSEIYNKNFTESKYSFEGFDYYTIPYPRSRVEWWQFLTGICNIKKLVRQNVTDIIAYNYPSVALYRLWKYCKRNKIKVTADCTEWYEATGNWIFRTLKELDSTFRMKVVQPKLDGIIAISKYLGEYYQNRGHSVIVVPPLVDLNMDKWKTLVFKENDSETIKLVYAGSPSKQKDDIGITIEVLLKLKESENIDFLLTVVGITEQEFQEMSGSMFSNNKMSSNIKFIGRVSHLAALEKISDADYHVFYRDNNLTNTAGFPTKFVESMACGTPVLTNSSSNIQDYIIEGKNGFLLNGDSKNSLTEGLHKALVVKRNEITRMKLFCKNFKAFHYENYLTLFSKFYQ